MSPVSIGACTDADEGRNKDGESGDGGDKNVVHTCLLIALAYGAALGTQSGVVVMSSVRTVVRFYAAVRWHRYESCVARGGDADFLRLHPIASYIQLYG